MTETKRRGRPPQATLEQFNSELADQLVDQTLRDISKGSSTAVEWRCPNFPDHIWSAKVYNRTNSKKSTGCPVCDGKKVLVGFNDVATTHPEAAALLLNPADRTAYTASSNKTLSFWCGEPLHQSWTAPLSRITSQGSKCGQCSGRRAVPGVDDLATTHPLIAAQLVDQSLANQLKAGSNQTVEWSCEDPDHAPWFDQVYGRTKHKRGCKECAHKASRMRNGQDGYPLVAPPMLGPQRARMSLREGFGDRVWLTEAEWQTFRLRNPVRYLSSQRKALTKRDGPMCAACGGKGSHEFPLQVSHRIPFLIGVLNWGLTPDWLDRIENLALAHKGACNHRVEIRDLDIPATLRSMGIDVNESPVIKGGHYVLGE